MIAKSYVISERNEDALSLRAVITMRHIPRDVLSQAEIAHEAIHDPSQRQVVINGVRYPITTYRNGCRFVQLGPYTVMEQNKLKNTQYGKRALMGERLSWVIPTEPGVQWHLIAENSSPK